MEPRDAKDEHCRDGLRIGKSGASGKLELMLTILFIILMVFGLFLAFSGISLTGSAIKDYGKQDTRATITSVGDTNDSIVLQKGDAHVCCTFSTAQGTKRCAVPNSDDCSACASYCG